MSLDIDITYVLVLALFLVPLLVLNGIVFRPFMALFEKRHEQLEGALERAQGLIEEAEAEANTFKEKIKVATNQGIEARNKIRGEAEAQMSAQLEAERQKVNEKLATALAEIEQKRQAAMGEIEAEAQKLADATASKLLGRTV